jgi:hypothetical protein
VILGFAAYERIEAACEALVFQLQECGLLDLLTAEADRLAHPDMFRRHGEYGLWLESVYDVLTEHEVPLPEPVQSKVNELAEAMGIAGLRIPRR